MSRENGPIPYTDKARGEFDRIFGKEVEPKYVVTNSVELELERFNNVRGDYIRGATPEQVGELVEKVKSCGYAAKATFNAFASICRAARRFEAQIERLARINPRIGSQGKSTERGER